MHLRGVTGIVFGQVFMQQRHPKPNPAPLGTTWISMHSMSDDMSLTIQSHMQKDTQARVATYSILPLVGHPFRDRRISDPDG